MEGTGPWFDFSKSSGWREKLVITGGSAELMENGRSPFSNFGFRQLPVDAAGLEKKEVEVRQGLSRRCRLKNWKARFFTREGCAAMGKRLAPFLSSVAPACGMPAAVNGENRAANRNAYFYERQGR
jgi:hypothetical protein